MSGTTGRIGRMAGRLTLVALVVTTVLAGASMAHAQTAAPVIVTLHLDGVVDPFTADYITGNVQRAEDQGAEAVLLYMDTPGGLGSSMDQITESFLASKIPVIAYVSPSGARAASAGAFILLSAPVAAMAPGTHVGASTPIGLSGGDLDQKVKNDATAQIEGLATTYGRNADVAATFVTQAASITAEQALDDGVIDLIAPSTQELLTTLNGTSVQLGDGTSVTLHTAGATLEDERMGAFVGFLHSLFDPNLAFIFFWLGLALIVLELIVPGHIFSGTIGTILLVCSLVSFGFLPVRIIGVVLLVISVIAFIVELKAPGLGIWGVVGVIALVAGGWFLYDRAGGVSVSPWVLFAVAAVVSLFFGVVVAAALRLRHSPSLLAGKTIVGAEGIALPTGVGPKGGVVRVASEEWRAIAPAGPISGGAKVRVTELDGLVLTVEPSDAEHVPAAPQAPAAEGRNTP